MISYEDRRQVHNIRSKSMRAMAATNSVNNDWYSNGRHRHIWIITGPAGCGKSTVAKFLADNLMLPFIEGDEYHTSGSVKKMAEGIPLTDADRWDWLVLLRKKAVETLTATDAPGVVLTCSALKHKYRDVIRIAAYNDHDLIVHFVFLHADEATLVERVQARKGHFMKSSMVHSQFVSLEEPEEDERDCLSVDVTGSVSAVQSQTLGMVRDALAQDV